MRVILKSRNGSHNAIGEFNNGKLTILKGSKINLNIASYFKDTKINKEIKLNKDIVDKFGCVLKDIEFPNPTAAAQFVTGRSVNGYISWRPNDKISLKEYLKEENNVNKG